MEFADRREHRIFLFEADHLGGHPAAADRVAQIAQLADADAFDAGVDEQAPDALDATVGAARFCLGQACLETRHEAVERRRGHAFSRVGVCSALARASSWASRPISITATGLTSRHWVGSSCGSASTW